MRKQWIAALAVAAMSVGVALCAQVPWRNPKVAQELGLTPDQVQKLEDLQYQHQKQMIDVRRDMALKRLDLKREMQKDNPDRATVDKLIDESSALKGRMQKMRLNHMLDAKKVLTPEQVQKVKERMAERRGRMRERGQDRFRQRDFRGGQGQGPGRGRGFGKDQGQGLSPGPAGPQPGAEMGPEQGPHPGGEPNDFAEMLGPEPGPGDEPEDADFEGSDGPSF